jgi:hypothetical protein
VYRGNGFLLRGLAVATVNSIKLFVLASKSSWCRHYRTFATATSQFRHLTASVGYSRTQVITTYHDTEREERKRTLSTSPTPTTASRDAATARSSYEPVALSGRDGEPHEFYGRLLGAGTSRAEHHSHAEPFAARGAKCSACRWFEVALYRRRRPTTSADAEVSHTFDYVVHTVGGTAVPGEERRSRVSYTSSAFEVIELLTVRPHHGEPFIAQQSARALAQAAQFDDDIRDAYINRAIV